MTKQRYRSRRVLLALLVVGICGRLLSAQVLPGKSQTLAEARRMIIEQLKAGKGLVVVAVSEQWQHHDSAKGDDETYGDWADNLNRFARSKPSGVKLVVVTPERYRRLVLDPKLKEKDGSGTLFIRDAQHVLVYDGAIMEQSVYKLGTAYMEKEVRPNEDARLATDANRAVRQLSDAGLREERLRLVAGGPEIVPLRSR